MNSYGSSEEHQPLTWIRGHPIYAAHALVGVYVMSMVITAIIGSASIPDSLVFRSDRVLRGEVWRLFTYGFLNPPTLSFAIEMVMIAWFGRELEKFYGLRKFITL
jgi:membrane associated rhomboid family serine protease